MDIVRNVSVRENCSDVSKNPIYQRSHRKSLPNISFKEPTTTTTTAGGATAPSPPPPPPPPPPKPHHYRCNLSELPIVAYNEEECAPISGRLEIRVVPQLSTGSTRMVTTTTASCDQWVEVKKPTSSTAMTATVVASVALSKTPLLPPPPPPTPPLIASSEQLVESTSPQPTVLIGNELQGFPVLPGDGSGGGGQQQLLMVNAGGLVATTTTTTTTTDCSRQTSPNSSIVEPRSGGAHHGGMAAALTNSKIPIFNPNIRILKCASWAGGECPPSSAAATSAAVPPAAVQPKDKFHYQPKSPEIQDLTPGKERLWFLVVMVFF